MMSSSEQLNSYGRAKLTNQHVCIRCGRRGTRGFLWVSGHPHDRDLVDQVICENRSACDRRLAVAERHEAKRGYWS